MLTRLLVASFVFSLGVGCGAQPPRPTDQHGSGSAGAHAHHAGHAGQANAAHITISCEPHAQEQFDRGLFFLHNMDYVSARRSFEEAAAMHAECAMLHWGAAMTYFQPLWPGQPTKESLEKGAAALARSRSGATKVGTFERALIDAAGAFYDGWDKTDSTTRFKSWEAAHRTIAQQFPDDIEAQALWALARLTTLDKKDRTYKEALAVAEMLQQLLAKRPDHPGLLHYLLHAYDNPRYAREAVGIARKYEEVSPDAAHALHMPSHIHVRLGNWQEVVDWNIKSAAAALKHPVAGRVSRDWLHATDYMVYGYLQKGDDARAEEAFGKIDPKTAYELNSGPGAYALAATAARFLLERRQWKQASELGVRRVDYSWDQYPWAEAVTYAARGLGAARSGSADAAAASLPELLRLKAKIESPWWQGRVQIEHDVIAGWIAVARGDLKSGEALLRGAAERELATGKDNVEPGHVITAVEELGDFLLEHQRPKEALDAYRSALAESPKRFNALYGAGRAAELAGLADDARRYYEELVATSVATTARPGRAHAVSYMGKRAR